MRQDAPECDRMRQDAPKCTRMRQHATGFSKLEQNLRGRVMLPQKAPGHTRTSWDGLRRCPGQNRSPRPSQATRKGFRLVYIGDPFSLPDNLEGPAGARPSLDYCWRAWATGRGLGHTPTICSQERCPGSCDTQFWCPRLRTLTCQRVRRYLRDSLHSASASLRAQTQKGATRS